MTIPVALLDGKEGYNDPPLPLTEQEQQVQINDNTTTKKVGKANSNTTTLAPTETLQFQLRLPPLLRTIREHQEEEDREEEVALSDYYGLLLDGRPYDGGELIPPGQLQHCIDEEQWNNFQQNLSDILEDRKDQLSQKEPFLGQYLMCLCCCYPCVLIVLFVITILYSDRSDPVLMMMMTLMSVSLVLFCMAAVGPIWWVHKIEQDTRNKIIELCREMSLENVTFHYREYQKNSYCYKSTYAREAEYVFYERWNPDPEIEVHFYQKEGDNNNSNQNSEIYTRDENLYDDPSQQRNDLFDSEDQGGSNDDSSFIAHLQWLPSYPKHRVGTNLPLALRPYISEEEWKRFCNTVDEIYERCSKRRIVAFMLTYFFILPITIGVPCIAGGYAFPPSQQSFFPIHYIPLIVMILFMFIIDPLLLVWSYTIREEPRLKFMEEINTLCNQVSTTSVTVEFEGNFFACRPSPSSSNDEGRQTREQRPTKESWWINITCTGGDAGRGIVDENGKEDDGTHSFRDIV